MTRKEAKEKIKEAINQEDVNKTLVVNFLQQAMIADLQAVYEIAGIAGFTLAGFTVLGKALYEIEEEKCLSEDK